MTPRTPSDPIDPTGGCRRAASFFSPRRTGFIRFLFLPDGTLHGILVRKGEGTMFLTEDWKDFEVLDTGDGAKLERWGRYVLDRPDPQVIWPKEKPALWASADAVYSRSDRGGGQWDFKTKLPESWTVSYRGLRFKVRPTGFKHTGLFPEQAVNWDAMSSLIRERVSRGEKVRMLNLFGYTGGATVACAAAGAHVTHVDAARGMVLWARENRDLNGIDETRFRFIVEDALAFVRREARRGSRYDAILMDPPSYGRGPGGEVWKIENELFGLVSACREIMSDRMLFFFINSYTTGLQPAVIANILRKACSSLHGTVDAQEVCLPVSSGGVLPCGATGRWIADSGPESGI